VASEECPVSNNDAPPTNPASPLHNKCPIQANDDRGPTHSVVLPSGIGGIDTKGNAPIGSVENINTLDPPPLGV
jgi:hypothetical protein